MRTWLKSLIKPLTPAQRINKRVYEIEQSLVTTELNIFSAKYQLAAQETLKQELKKELEALKELNVLTVSNNFNPNWEGFNLEGHKHERD